MLTTLAVENYRSLRSVVLPLGRLTVVTGANGTGTVRCCGPRRCSPTCTAAGWIAALLAPRAPELLVLNEPETSLHPDLLPPLAELIARPGTGPNAEPGESVDMFPLLT